MVEEAGKPPDPARGMAVRRLVKETGITEAQAAEQFPWTAQLGLALARSADSQEVLESHNLIEMQANALAFSKGQCVPFSVK